MSPVKFHKSNLNLKIQQQFFSLPYQRAPPYQIKRFAGQQLENYQFCACLGEVLLIWLVPYGALSLSPFISRASLHLPYNYRHAVILFDPQSAS